MCFELGWKGLVGEYCFGFVVGDVGWFTFCWGVDGELMFVVIFIFFVKFIIFCWIWS